MPATADDLKQIDEEIARLKKQRTAMLRESAQMIVENYTLRRTDGSEARLSDLFGNKRDMLLVHNMGRSCPYCTLWADGFNGVAHHLQNRAAFVLSTPDEPGVAREFSESRDWRYPVVSIAGTTLAQDLGFSPEPGKYMPGVSALRKDDQGTIRRTGMSFFGPGDDFCPVWPLFDLLKDGDNGWEPKYSY